MSWFARLALALCLAGLLLTAALSLAAVDGPPMGARSEMVPPRSGEPAAVSQRPATEMPTLRCWQEGRLVLEQPNVRFKDAPSGALVFRKRDRYDQPVLVFDMKNGLCMLSHEAGVSEK